MSNKLHTFFHGWNKRVFLAPSDSSAYLSAGGLPAHRRRRCLNSAPLKDGPDSSRDEGCYGYPKTDAPSDRCPAGRAVGIRVRCSGQMGHYHSRAPFNQGVTHPFSSCFFHLRRWILNKYQHVWKQCRGGNERTNGKSLKESTDKYWNGSFSSPFTCLVLTSSCPLTSLIVAASISPHLCFNIFF